MKKSKKNTTEEATKEQKPSGVVKVVCIVVSILFTVALISTYLFYYINSSGVRGDIQLKKERLAVLETEVKDLSSLLEKYSQDIEKFEKILFKDKDIPLFLEGVSESAKEHDVRVIWIKALPPKRVETEEDEGRFLIDARDAAERLTGMVSTAG